MNARLYDPILGRMLGPDNVIDLGNSQGMNSYTYAYNNPLKYVDPSGNNPILIGAAIGALFDIGIQLWSNGGDFSKINWGSVVKSAIAGAVGGGVGQWASGLFKFGGIASERLVNALQGAIGGAFGGGAGGFTAGALEQQSGRDLFISTITGFFTGGALGATFGYFKKISKPANETGGIKSVTEESQNLLSGSGSSGARSTSGLRNGTVSGEALIMDGIVPSEGANNGGYVWQGPVQGGSFVPGNSSSNWFSISDWTGYPSWAVKPQGPFRQLEGAEYKAARELADRTNAAIRRANPNIFKNSDLEIHEMTPVKFGGSPTDPANKIYISGTVHDDFSRFWTKLRTNLKKKP